MGRVCGTYDRREECIQVLIGGPEGNRPLGIPWSRWDDEIKKDLQDVGWEYDLIHDRDKLCPVVCAEMNIRIS